MRFSMPRKKTIDDHIDDVSMRSRVIIYAHLYRTATRPEEKAYLDNHIRHYIATVIPPNQRQHYTKLYEEEQK